ncbi:MAG: DegT/DnrJ/EryC1/StrS family aminotransferase [Candidatus Pacearchaeota archaeon]
MITQIEPWIDESELLEIKRAVDNTFFTENKLTSEFEEMVKNYTGSKYDLAVCNATAGLFCILKALDIGPGDEVIVPNITFIATSNAVIMAGATPVICDVKRDTFCIDPEDIEKRITERTKAVIPVHLYGQSTDMNSIIKIAQKYNLKIIEDAAQALGVTYMGKSVGTFGEAGVISFYGNKIITTGEGGIILTNDKLIYKKCYRLKNHGRDTKGTFIHEFIGFNFCSTDLQAAVGISQMKKLDKIIQRKKEIFERYKEGLKDIPYLKPLHIEPNCQPVYRFSNFIVDKIEALVEFLKDNGIQTRRAFFPLHLQPCYKNSNYIKYEGEYKNSIFCYEKLLSLPSSYKLKIDEQELVINKIREFCGY